ncbi:MAG TPA: nitrilase-related carbon-nitrogen hydrolase [Solirubrobacteraceae bacterium]|nr:nitrilase-related carbon-nitrogen hydrolase [Solirubrobacteraceae bacterium]
MRIACCQLAPDVENPEGNPARGRDALARAIAGGAHIVVLPELSNSGYVFAAAEEVHAAAVPSDGELLRGWSEEARRGDALVIGGFCERAPDGTIYNSSALVDGDGVVAVYRKLHLWGEEARWFSPGQDPAPVVDTRYGRIGLAVCYDLEFPELTRGLALHGADLIALPANWPRDEPPPDGRPILHSLALTTAYLNRVFVAVCDRCGIERGLDFEGGSVFAGPDGWLRAGPVADRGEEILWADADLALAREKRNGEHNDALADRRPDRYAPGLASRAGA